MRDLQPYQGTTRGIVLGIDVGTTYSGVAYAILDPGEVPKIHGVTRYGFGFGQTSLSLSSLNVRFPGQECSAGDSKIPSILYYNPDGTVHSAGAEAARPGIEIEAEDNELVLVEWFV